MFLICCSNLGYGAALAAHAGWLPPIDINDLQFKLKDDCKLFKYLKENGYFKS